MVVGHGREITGSKFEKTMNSKLLICLALVLSGGSFGCSAADPEPLVAGGWSEPVNGLRGRLLFTEDARFNGTRMGAVYLEIQNVSDVLNPMEIYYDTFHALPCELLDGSNQPVAQAASPADIMSPTPFWIMLPYDSTLRFRVSVSGYGIPKDAGLSIGLMSGNWIIPPTSRAACFLSASFSVTPPETKDHLHAWHGVLNLPKVKISTNSP
jgi:hypothetical protein